MTATPFVFHPPQPFLHRTDGPDSAYVHTLVFWSPHEFCKSTLRGALLRCPHCRCASKLFTYEGWTRPRVAAGISAPWFLVGRKLQCGNPDCRKHFLSYDQGVLSRLAETHPGIAASFGALLTHRAAISVEVVQLMRCTVGAVSCSISFAALASIIRELHSLRHLSLRTQYVQMIASWRRSPQTYLSGKYKTVTEAPEFSELTDPHLYGAVLPSSAYLASCFAIDMMSQQHVEATQLAMVPPTEIVSVRFLISLATSFPRPFRINISFTFNPAPSPIFFLGIG